MQTLFHSVKSISLVASLLLLVACGGGDKDSSDNKDNSDKTKSNQPPINNKATTKKPRTPTTYVPLVESRKGFKTKLTRKESAGEPLDQPGNNPAGKGFSVVQYDAPGGKYPAYLYTPSSDEAASNGKLPAIIWITGGDCNTIGDIWTPAEPENDQNATAFRNAGVVMMFPSMRGGNQNAGYREAFLGEVDDVLAARTWLAKQPNVDANRIYLGGHSTGGTLALLVAECSDDFRAVFSFGPVENVAFYGPEMLPFVLHNSKEIKLRSPGNWLKDIKTPTFIIEGTRQSNYASLVAMQGSRNPNVHALPVHGADHFSVLAPINALIAQRILKDTEATCNIKLTAADMKRAFGK